VPLSRERVLAAAIALADAGGVEALSMRKLAQELGVVPMALYKHVANKDELLDGMIDQVFSEIDPPAASTDWRAAIRGRVLSARQALLRHRWASRVIESRTQPTPAVTAYIDETIGAFREGGLSVDLTHHAMHAMGSRLYGFSQELFDDPDGNPPSLADMPPEVAARFPYLTELTRAVFHDEGSVVGLGCDDQVEFEFALDLLLDGLERRHLREQRSQDR
jgi:AcrR family transcriptional regulator